MFEIASPPRYHLKHPPLAQALVQVRFPLVAHFQELIGISGVQDALQDLFPYMEKQNVQQLTVALGPGILQPQATESAVLWRFTADDQWTFVLSPGAATLIISGEDYSGVEDFAARFSRTLEALHATQRVRRCDRIGIRYVNVVEMLADGLRPWSRWFKSELIGWTGSSVIGSDTRLHVSLTESQLSADPSGSFTGFPSAVQALIRHGVLPPGTEIPLDTGMSRRLSQESYVLDVDLFIQAPQVFDTSALMRQFKSMHAQIDAFFRWTLTKEGEEHFGLEEI